MNGAIPAPRQASQATALDALRDWQGFRRVYCRRYDVCLDVAHRNRWQSFMCRACDVQDEISREERAKEEFAILRGLSSAVRW